MNSRTFILVVAFLSGALGGAYNLPHAHAAVAAREAGVRVYPNPFNAREHAFGFVTIDGLDPSSSVEIYDVTGRMVRRIEGGPGVRWDLRNDSGSEVSSGKYTFLAETASGRVRGSIGVIR